MTNGTMTASVRREAKIDAVQGKMANANWLEPRLSDDVGTCEIASAAAQDFGYRRRQTVARIIVLQLCGSPLFDVNWLIDGVGDMTSEMRRDQCCT